MDVLSKKTIDKVLRLIRKLDWNDPEIVKLVHKIFTKPWKIRYSNIGLLAMLTYDLQRYHPEFAIAAVDQVLEDIRRGLETNVYKHNQRRIATVKFLGELYIYRLIGSGIVFDTLWLLATFAHPDGRPMPNQLCSLDTPDDFFRIRLICILLDGCGMCFDRGSLKKKLDAFLTFFQLYVLCKDELPMDVDFMLSDTIEALRPKIVHFKTFEEAAEAVNEMMSSAMQSAGVDDGEESDGGDDSGEEGERRNNEVDPDDLNAEDNLTDGRPSSPDALVVRPKVEVAGPSEVEDADFAKELAKMMSDTSSEARKVDKRTALAMWDSSSLPTAGSVAIRRKKEEDGGQEVEDTEEGIMRFTLLSKKGHKQQARELSIPATSTIAIQTKNAQLQSKVEQQQLKKLVLDYEQRDSAEEMKAIEASIRNKGIRVKYS
jgi:regulator of nonsense transcripts 2